MSRARKSTRKICCGCSWLRFLFLASAVALWLSFVIARAQHFAPDHSELPIPLRPYRPGVILTLNYLLATFPFSLLVPSIKADDILYGAELQTGLHDWDDGDGTFRDGFTNLSASLEREGELTPVGTIWARLQLQIILSNRLKLIQYIKDHPEVLKDDVVEPVFILGTPRSGTSFMFNLLKFDEERFRSPRLWELNDPIPPTDPDFPNEYTWRVYQAELGLEVFRALAPTVTGVYSVAALNAEECMPILAFQAMSLHYNTLFKVPSYQRWLMEQKQYPALLFHKKYLQVLQSGRHPQSEKKTWLLKTPWHMNHLEEIWELYPRAKIIMPVRSPVGLIPSLGSLHARFYGIVSDEVDPKDIGRFQFWQWNKIFPRFAQARSLNKDKSNQIVDVHFENLLQDPLEVVQTVYSFFGWNLSDKVKTKMQAYLEGTLGDGSGDKSKKKKHDYKPEWFGISEEEYAESKAFLEYCKEYNLEMMFRHSEDMEG
mmetsp:Transcript_17756/g.23245  ORF Transcript_17756/g.23245 Transcript_17756/m.23245 type:complete len:486 (-) Transcript_17756:1053-2510(-)